MLVLYKYNFVCKLNSCPNNSHLGLKQGIGCEVIFFLAVISKEIKPLCAKNVSLKAQNA